MKLYTGILISLLACCMACNNANRQANESDETKGDTPTAVVDDTHISITPIPLDGCYKLIKDKDTATMRLNVIDSFVTGELRYHWEAKDNNDGSIKGVIRDSLIIADYTFRSEGTMSVRQVAFKLAGTSLVEGFGDLDTSSDTFRFKNPGGLKFQYDRPFIKTPCVE
jgi:hypothetical protein